MNKTTFLFRLAVVACLIVINSCYPPCSKSTNGIVDGILGQSVLLSCGLPNLECGQKVWSNITANGPRRLSVTRLYTINSHGDILDLHIFEVTKYHAGAYVCWCEHGDTNATVICGDTLRIICQAEVVVKGARELYNSSSSDPNVINVAKKTRINITCPKGATPETNCSESSTESDESTLSFIVKKRHNSCIIACQVRHEEKIICSANLTLNVSTIESSQPSNASSPASAAKPGTIKAVTAIPDGAITSTSENTTDLALKREGDDIVDADKTGSFPILILVGILIVIFVGVLFVVFVYIFYSKSTARSRSDKNINQVDPSSTDANMPAGPTYATVNKSTEEWQKEGDDSIEQGFTGADDAYSEVNGARNVDSTTQQAKSTKSIVTITNDYYSEVNKPKSELESVQHGAKTDDYLYSEVSKVKEQVQNKESPSSDASGYDHIAPRNQTDQTVEQPKNVDDETDGGVSTSTQVLYAVVDKKKK